MENQKKFLKESYLAFLKNSIDSISWQQFYINSADSALTEILNNGQLSCAYFVSSILKLFNLGSEIHMTVASIVEELTKQHFFRLSTTSLEDPFEPGDLLIYSDQDGDKNTHIAIYIGDYMAISNSSSLGKINKHHYLFENIKNNKLVLSRAYRIPPDMFL